MKPYFLLWITAIALFITYSYDYGENGPDQQGHDIIIRSRRNVPSANIAQFLDRTSIIARIANGIALQAGLMDGKIPIDDVVGELLNFGTVKLSDVVGFKLDNMTGMTIELKKLPTSLDNSAIDAENTTLAWNNFRIQTESVGDVKIPGKEDYFTQIESFKSLDFKDLSPVHDSLVSLAVKLVGIEKLDVNETTPFDVKETTFMTTFVGLPFSFKTVAGHLDKLKGLSDKLNETNSIGSGSLIFEPIQKMTALIKTRLSLKNPSPRSVKNNVQQVLNIVPIAKTCREDVEKLSKLMKHRFRTSLTKRKYTIGFSNGISDVKQLMKDVHDPWIKQVTSSTLALNMLADGFEPLFEVQKQLSRMDQELEPISKIVFYQSLLSLSEVQNLISPMSQDLVDSADVLANFTICKVEGSGKTAGDTNSSEQVIKEIKSLGESFAALNGGIQRVDQLKQKMDDFIKFLNFTGPTDKKASSNEVPEVLRKIKSTDDLDKLRKLIGSFSRSFDVNTTEMKAQAQRIHNDKNEITYPGVDAEIEMYKCFQGLKSKSEKIARAIEITRKLRSLDVAEIETVEKVTSDLASVSKKLINVKSIPKEMNDESDKISKELNKMPESMDILETIGQSVNSLRNVYRLKKLESSITHLKSVGAIVEREFDNIYLKTVQKAEIQKQWGDHKKDMDELEAVLKQVNEFENSLNGLDAKTLVEYVKPIVELTKFKDVIINFKDKTKGIEALLSVVEDPKDKEDLEKSKETLEKLDALDLKFSNYKTQFQKAPSAFQSLYDFLVDFSTVKIPQNAPLAAPPPVIIASDNTQMTIEEDEEDGSMIILWIFIGLLVTSLIAAFIAWRCGCFKKKTEPIVEPTPIYIDQIWRIDGNGPVPQHLVIVWLGNQIFKTNLDAFNCHESIIRMMMVEDAKRINTFMYPLSIRKHRVPTIYCNPATALTNLAKMRIYIHANRIITKNGKIFIATQTPMLKTSEHDDTTEEFWMMAMLEGSDRIVMISSQSTDSERMTYLYATCGDDKICGRFTVRTRDFCDFLPGKYSGSVFKRVVEVTDTKKQFTTRQYTHFQFPIWDDQSIPLNGHEPAFSVLREVLQSDKPIIVHCQTGTGRTMSFIGIEYIAREIEYDTNMTFSTAMAKLNEQRWFGFQTTRQSLWVHSGVVGRIAENIDIKYSPYPEMLETLNEVAYEQKGIPAVDNRNVKF